MTKETKKRVGFWHSKDEPTLPMPVANSDELTEAARKTITKYLDNGRETSRYRGYSTCRICNKRNGSSDMTDGEFTWPSGLSHYVTEHHVKLPDEFVSKILPSKLKG